MSELSRHPPFKDSVPHVRLKSRIIGPFAAILLLVITAFMLTTFLEESEHISHELISRATSFEQHLQEHVHLETQQISLALSLIATSPDFTSALQQRDREHLLELEQPYFSQWRDKYTISHFYFHAPDRINILRVHQPERFGDLIDRNTTLMAQQTNSVTSGVEMGPLGTFTLRVVIPVYHDSRLAGFVELGKEIEYLIDHLVHLSGLRYIITLRKEHLTRPQWEEGMRVLGRKPQWDDYADVVVQARTISETPDALARALTQNRMADLDAESNLHGSSGIFRAKSLPLRDDTGDEVGNIILVQDTTARLRDMFSTLGWTLAASFALGLPGLWLIYLLLKRIEADLRAAREKLLEETRSREQLQHAHIRELKEQQTLLQQAITANRHKSEFLARMSHELRTPLHAIIGYSDAMLEGLDGSISDAQGESLRVIHDNGAHLLDLINDLLDLTKIEAGKMSLHKNTMELARLIDDTLKTVAPMIQKKGLKLITHHAPLPQISIDPMRIKQVLLNLLSNAIKFTEQGEIVIETHALAPGDPLPGNTGKSSEEHLALVSIKDSGIGMDQQELSEIFKEFYQADRSHREPGSGTGLGLAISNCLVQMHGGQIWASSTPEQGTTFWFTLPATVWQPADGDFQQAAGI